MASQVDLSSALELLGTVTRGKATITVGGRPFVSVDADEKTIGVDAGGLREAGFSIRSLGGKKSGPLAPLAEAVSIASGLSEQGWRLTLQAEGEKVLTLGSGVSRVTARIRLNPLKVRKLLKAME